MYKYCVKSKVNYFVHVTPKVTEETRGRKVVLKMFLHEAKPQRAVVHLGGDFATSFIYETAVTSLFPERPIAKREKRWLHDSQL